IDAPIVLVVDSAAAGRSVAALVHGFATFDPQVRIAGVIANRVGSPRHVEILTDALRETGIPLIGAIRRQDDLVTPSRHLGLIPAAERTVEARRTVDALGRVVEQSVDLDAVLAIARAAGELAAPSLVLFDPVHDEQLPRGISGLVIGGGFPEAHAEALSANSALRADVEAAVRRG